MSIVFDLKDASDIPDIANQDSQTGENHSLAQHKAEDVSRPGVSLGVSGAVATLYAPAGDAPG